MSCKKKEVSDMGNRIEGLMAGMRVIAGVMGFSGIPWGLEKIDRLGKSRLPGIVSMAFILMEESKWLYENANRGGSVCLDWNSPFVPAY